MPGVSASGESSNKGVSADLSTTGEQTVSRQHSLGVGVTSYELDFFGRIQSLKDKALETYLGTEEAYRSARLSLVSEVAQAYLALVADRERLNIATETLKSQQASYEMIARRHSVGVSSAAGSAPGADQRGYGAGGHCPLQWAGGQGHHGAQPARGYESDPGHAARQGALRASGLAGYSGEPALHGAPPAPGHPSGRAYVKAANADIGAARANFFPRISLTANIGTASNELSHLFDGGTGIWTFLPQVSLPIFEGGRNVANLRVSEADKKIAVANYEKAIQSAFREVSDALIDRVSLAGQLEAQKSLVHATSETYRLSGERYNQGIDSYLAVLDSQRAMYSSQLNLISVRVARRAEPYHALQGPWGRREGIGIKLGGGPGGPCPFLRIPRKGASAPPAPLQASPSPKTFDFIESLLQGSAYEKGPSPFPGKVSFFVLRKGRRQRSGVNYTIN